jgi:DNA modification methylase
MNELHFGDNLEVLRKMPAESVDLIYLDPPFNSNANYNVLMGPSEAAHRKRRPTLLKIHGNGAAMRSGHWTKLRHAT